MKRTPIELASGKLGCPECRCPLEPRLVPVYHDGIKLGAFDGMACEMCGYGALTEKGRGDRERALEAPDRIPLPYPPADVVEKYAASSPRASPVTRGDLSVEKTMCSTPTDMQPPAVMILQKTSSVTARIA